VEEFMVDLRESLDDLVQAIEDENPEHDMEDAIDSIIEAHDAQVANERATMDDFDKLDISYGLAELESAEHGTDPPKVSLPLRL
jgi:hypothetical protein